MIDVVFVWFGKCNIMLFMAGGEVSFLLVEKKTVQRYKINCFLLNRVF